MSRFRHAYPKQDKNKSTEPYKCEAPGCGRYAVDKAVSYRQLKTKPDEFRETERHYWCGSHRTPGVIEHQDGTTDPSDYESISDTDDYT